VSTVSERRAPRLTAVMREGERVTPLELFFDLVFVLALTQSTTLMARIPTWEGLLKGLLVLGILWWSWVGYAWLTSVIDPEEGGVRLAMFVAMAGLLVAALCVPGAFGDEALLFVCVYAVVRGAHIALFTIASRDDAQLRHSVVGLAASTALCVGLLVAAAFVGGAAQIGLWALALALDMLGPYLFGADGWKLVPGHFAERHGLIVLIALGESIVALGVGAKSELDAGIVTAAVLGMVVAVTLWWVYFDVTAIVAERRLTRAQEGRERNELARDSYSYMHFPMVAGIALLAVGVKHTLADVSAPLQEVPTVALLGGAAMYLLAHVAFRLRNMHTLSRRRLIVAIALIALVPVTLVLGVSSLGTLALLAAAMTTLILYEALRYADARDRVRHGVASPEATPLGADPATAARENPAGTA
jgi:low temperature requirement protein LtrA